MRYHLTHIVKTLALLMVGVVFVLQVAPVFAQFSANQKINYQGKLVTPAGVAVPNATYTMAFNLYTVATSGAAIWTETRSGGNQVQVTNGLFSVMLGDISSLAAVNFNRTLYLGVTIATDTEMLPRKILGTVPAAFEAKNAQTVGGIASTSLLRNDVAGTLAALTTTPLLTITQTGTGNILDLFDGAVSALSVIDGGNVGIGSSSPSSKLTVVGSGYFGGNLTATGTLTITGTTTLSTTTANNLTLTQALALTSGGTGATTAALARTNLGATTVGANIFTLTNPGALTLLQINADNTVSAVATSSLGLGSSFTNSDQLAALLSDETGSAGGGLSVFSNGPTFTGTTNFANLIVMNATTTQLTISSLTSGRVPYVTTGGRIIDSANFVFDGANVGIGTSSPASKLDVWGNFTVGTSASPVLFANSASGRVGIGTNNPSQMFEVRSTNASFNTNADTINLERITNVCAGCGPDMAFNRSRGTAYGSQSIVQNGDTLGDFSFRGFDSSNYDVGALFGARVDGTPGSGNDMPTALYFRTSADGTANSPTERLTIKADGKVGVGTSSPNSLLTVAGTFQVTGTSTLATSSLTNLTVTGALRDSAASAGTLGMILQSTGTSSLWVATSSLGLSSSFTTSAELAALLSDETGSAGGGLSVFSNGPTFTGTTNFANLIVTNATTTQLTISSLTSGRVPYVTTGGRIIDSANFVFDGTNVGIGTSSPSSLFAVAGTSTYSGPLNLVGTNANIALGSNFLSGDGDDEGILIDSSGNVSGSGNLSLVGNVNASGTLNSSGVLTIAGTTRIQVNGTMIAKAGIPSSPAFQFDNDGNTGIYQVTNDVIGFSTNGLNRVVIDDVGRMGIGSSSPFAKLTVTGSGTTTGVLVQFADVTDTPRLTLLDNGNLGLGTTSPTSRLALQVGGYTASGTAGFERRYDFANTASGSVQFAEQAYLKTTNTATTTIVGSMFRLEDSTTFGNTVRGFEVQAQRGTNTRGENTALSGFARTFGVRGTTEGDAGSVFEPAGVYGETRGTTQGNALRGYSGSITTAALVQLFQDTSAFSGTGLLMNFGNTSGSFSSSSSRFIDLKNAGTSKFVVSAQGTTTIGDGTTNNMAGLQIGFGGLCVDNDGSCTASTSGRISSVSSVTGNSDLAEMYFSSERLVPGDIVYTKGNLSVGRATAATKEKIIGVVSTKPGLIMGFDDKSLTAGETAYPIALTGRVPIRLSNENGDVKIGDELMLSSINGVAMKATGTGAIIGVALEDFDPSRAYSDTFVNQFGDDIIVPVFTPVTSVSDPRINNGCYYGGGNETGEETCVPLRATTTDATVAEASRYGAAAARTSALRALARERSQGLTTGTNQPVQVGQIVMFVDLRYRYLGEAQETMLASLMAPPVNQSTKQIDETVWNRLVALATNFVDGILTLTGLKADKIETDELCIGAVCVDAVRLQELLDNQRVPEPSSPPPPPPPPPEPTAEADDTPPLSETPPPETTPPSESGTDTDSATPPALPPEPQVEPNSTTPTPPAVETLPELLVLVLPLEPPPEDTPTPLPVSP